MSDREAQTLALFQALEDIRLPSDAPGGLLAEVLVAAGAGLLLAAGIAWLFGQAVAPQTAMPQSRASAGSRQIALLRRLAQTNPDAVTDDIYKPGQLPDEAELERSLAALEARRDD